MSIKFQKSHIVGLSITIGVFIFTSLLFQTRIFDRMELGATDLMFFFRAPFEKTKTLQEGVKSFKPNIKSRKDIIILGIDESTIRDFSDQGIQWPFPWNIHAKFTRFIGSGKPLAIFFDIMFLDHKKGEDELAEAIKGAGNVFLDFPFETEDVEKDYSDQKERLKLLGRLRFPVDPNDKTEELVEEAVPPTPLITKAAKGIGFANVFPGEDNINRTVPLILKFKGWYYPNIDLTIVMHYYGIGKEDVEIKWGEYIKLKNIPEKTMPFNPQTGKITETDIMKKTNEKREIIIPIDEYGFMDINFVGGPGSYQHYPYHLFCRDGDMGDNTSLKDKIVLVAAYSATGIATDEKQSPYGATFGIEHHANALNTILNQDFLYKLSDFQNLIIMLIIAIFFGLITTRFSIKVSLIFTIVFTIFFAVGAYLLFYYLSLLAALSTPTIQIGLTFTLIMTYRLLTEQKEKKYIRQTFSKFVSKSVVDDLLKNPHKIKLGGEKKICTVLFSDIRGFTSFSEKMTPEQLVELLNVYLQAMTDIVIKYNGTLDKYVGDEIMAFWGAPIPQENHAMLSARAALEMMEKLHSMNKSWEAEGKDPMDIGIGLNSGDMIVGNMGSSSRMDYTLMGDNVNLGSRIEGTNKIYKTNIIITEATYEHIKDNATVRELDLIRVKGKKLPVKIYELLDMKN